MNNEHSLNQPLIEDLPANEMQKSPLYDPRGPLRGFDAVALVAVLCGAGMCIPGFLAAIGVCGSIPPFFKWLYDVSWFTSGFVAAAIFGCYKHWQRRRKRGL